VNDGDLYYTEAEGDIEKVENIIKITRIRATYHLRVPKEKTGEARDAFSSYLKLCPGAQSVINCIEIRDNLVLEETD
jgi:hypothetical protein